MARTARFAFAVIALAVSVLFALLQTGPERGTQPSTAPPIAYTYDTTIYDQPTGHTAVERGSLAHTVGLRISAGHGTVDGRSDGTLARPETAAAAVIYAYDVTAQLVHGASIGAAGTRAEQVVTGESSWHWLGFVAAKSASAGWKVGDDVYGATKAGNSPAWSTVRSRFWKNSAADSKTAGQWDGGNLARMQGGRAPQRFNPDKGGMESMELSHEPIPFRNGGRDFVPRWPQDHAAVDPFRFPGY